MVNNYIDTKTLQDCTPMNSLSNIDQLQRWERTLAVTLHYNEPRLSKLI